MLQIKVENHCLTLHEDSVITAAETGEIYSKLGGLPLWQWKKCDVY
jgi:hypothetical protein